VKLIDANLLLYGVNVASPMHARARVWLEAAFRGDEVVALPWVVLLGFLRVATSPRALPRPLSAELATDVIDGWLALPNVVAISAGEDHWNTLRALLSQTGTAGNLTTDAHLAALAIEYDCELYSTDADFARFAAVRWVNPLAA